MSKTVVAQKLFNTKLVTQALKESVLKFAIKEQAKNPVMFVVLVGAFIVTVSAVASIFSKQPYLFEIQIAIWLWFTVFFSNFSEALAEGRGKAQAASLRSARSQNECKKLADGKEIKVNSTQLRAGDLVVCVTGDLIPRDGEVVEGIATVDESAITGESAPVIR